MAGSGEATGEAESWEEPAPGEGEIKPHRNEGTPCSLFGCCLVEPAELDLTAAVWRKRGADCGGEHVATLSSLSMWM